MQKSALARLKFTDKEQNLPLEFVGEEEGTSRSVYKLTGLLNSDVMLSLKSHGYVNESARLKTGEVIDNAWVKQA